MLIQLVLLGPNGSDRISAAPRAVGVKQSKEDIVKTVIHTGTVSETAPANLNATRNLALPGVPGLPPLHVVRLVERVRL